MPGNPKGSKWRSTPRKRRHRVAPSWTYPPALIVHVRREAAREGISASELSERCLVAQLGEPPPLPEDEEPETVKENRRQEDPAMMHVVAYIHHTADPLAEVCGVFSSRAAAVAAMPPGSHVLPVTWPAYACRNPRQGDMLATAREASGLVAVAPRRT